MCGIAGWLDWKKDLRAQVEQIETMTNVLAHRVPMLQTFGPINIFCLGIQGLL
ncbi:hypothetical protein JCM19039_2633 [Geomicrobium sp. JCM 19039]|nr:hypothetical protein JCM19039_2633 [Geomicrobium sp. JCM 19039]